MEKNLISKLVTAGLEYLPAPCYIRHCDDITHPNILMK